MRVFIGWIKIQMVGLVGHNGTVGSDVHRMTIPLGNCALPTCTPTRRARRKRHAADRLAVGLSRTPISTTDEAFTTKVDLVYTEVIDAHAVSACTNERVELFVLEEECHAACQLIGVVTASHTLARCRIVRLADARKQCQMHVVELERSHDDDVGRLEDFFLRLVVKIGNAGCSLAVRCHFDTQNFRFRTV